MFDLGYVEGEYDVGNVITRGMNRGRAEGVTLGYSYFKEDSKGEVEEGEFRLKLSALEAFAIRILHFQFVILIRIALSSLSIKKLGVLIFQ